MQYITYFDEVKSNPNHQTMYVVGGLAIPLSSIKRLEAELNNLALRVFNTKDLTNATEFHSSNIYSAKGAFKGRPPTYRLALFAELGRILNLDPDVRRIYAAVDTSKLRGNPDPAETAFAYFCERVQKLIGASGSTILIGDLDRGQTNKMIRRFAEFRANGTPWAYGIKISSIVDAVHFVESHHSRMIQLADVYLFFLTHRWGARNGWFADKLRETLSTVELYGHRYKIWPA